MQPSLCVGLFGPRRAGKTTLLKALLDNESDPTSEAAAATTGLRFAHAQVHKRNGGFNSRGEPYPYYRSFGNMLPDDKSSALVDDRDMVDDDNEILSGRAVSFVDCPGHMGSIATMLKGIMMSDAVLILSRPEASFSDPPTLEVLAAADLMGKTIVVVQSRTETANKRTLENHRAQIQKDTYEITHKHVPIVAARAGDLSSIADFCTSMLEDMMRGTVTVPRNMLAADEALLLVGASYVLGGPVTPEEMQAAAAAAAAGDAMIFVKIYGRLVQGTLAPGDQVEVRPGVTVADKERRVVVCHPIILKVSSVVHPAADQQPAVGGGVLLALRATATVANGDGRQQQLVRGVVAGEKGLEGHVLGHGVSLPGVYVGQLEIKFWLVKKMGVKAVELNQELLLIIGTMSTYGRVRKIHEVTEEEGPDAGGESSSRGGKAKAKKKNISRSVDVMVVGGLSPPTCARPSENILICRRLGSAWHFMGRGQIMTGVSAQVSYDQY